MEKCKQCGQVHEPIQAGHRAKVQALPLVNTTISVEGQPESIVAVGTAFVGLNLEENEKGMTVKIILTGSYNLETTMAMINAFDSAKTQLAEQLYEHSNPVDLMGVLGMIGKEIVSRPKARR